MSNWFEYLFGFEKGPYKWTQQQFGIDAPRLTSKHNDHPLQGTPKPFSQLYLE